jgi:hypothetical protein
MNIYDFNYFGKITKLKLSHLCALHSYDTRAEVL